MTFTNNVVSSAPQAKLNWLRDLGFLGDEFILYFGCFHYVYNEHIFIEICLIFFLKNFYWGIVDSQCCINFRCKEK